VDEDDDEMMGSARKIERNDGESVGVEVLLVM